MLLLIYEIWMINYHTDNYYTSFEAPVLRLLIRTLENIAPSKCTEEHKQHCLFFKNSFTLSENILHFAIVNKRYMNMFEVDMTSKDLKNDNIVYTT